MFIDRFLMALCQNGFAFKQFLVIFHKNFQSTFFETDSLKSVFFFNSDLMDALEFNFIRMAKIISEKLINRLGI